MRLIALCAVFALGVVAACDRPERIEANQAVPAAEPAPGPSPEHVQSPEALVQALYLEPSIPTTAPQARLFFVEALAGAMEQPPGEEPRIDFDYRHDAQDADIAGLVVEEVAAGPNGSAVTARFSNFGRPVTIAYDLCRREDGEWRIADVRGVQNDWSLRDVAGVPAQPGETCL